MNTQYSKYFEKYKYMVLLLILTIIYCYFSSTLIGFGDALGFVWAAEEGFTVTTNANAHFLYLNLLRLLYLTFNSFSAFQIGSFFSIFFALVTLFVLHHIVLLNTQNRAAATIAMVAFGLSFTFWRQSEIIEVYTLNLAIVSIIIYLLLVAFESKSSRLNFWIATLFGLAILVHIKNILLLPAILFVFYHINKQSILKILVHILPAFLIGSILIIIPLATASNTLTSILFENSDVLSKAIDHDIKFYLTSMVKHIGYLLYNFHLLTIAIGYGIFVMYKKNIIVCLFLIAAGLPYFIFSMLFDVADSYVFALIFYLVLAIFLGESINSINQYCGRNWKIVFWGLVFSAPLIYYSIFYIAQNIDATKEISQSKAYKGGFKYLLWPGMRNNVGLIPLSKQIQLQSIKPFYFADMEWNYKQAIEYLEWKNEKK